MRTLKFKIQPTVTIFTAVNHCSGPLRKQKRLAQQGSCSCTVIGGFQSTLSVCIFCGRLLVAIIKIDSSKSHKSLARVEVRSPYVIERQLKV